MDDGNYPPAVRELQDTAPTASGSDSPFDSNVMCGSVFTHKHRKKVALWLPKPSEAFGHI
jgi:hypothetical protein